MSTLFLSNPPINRDQLSLGYFLGINRELQRVHKKRLDRAVASVSPYVSKITAFAWDPMFTCRGKGSASLSVELLDGLNEPIISECRFHSQSNQSVVLIGYNFDALMLKFNVSLTSLRASSTNLMG